MSPRIQKILGEDHHRLDLLLQRARGGGRAIDVEAYEAFRAGLLRHISQEERILLPTAQRLRGGDPLPVAVRLRADHAVLAALLVPRPTHAVLDTIASILQEHNPLEEGPTGAYASCERLAGEDEKTLVQQLENVPPVRLAPHVDGPHVDEHIERLLRIRAEIRAREAGDPSRSA